MGSNVCRCLIVKGDTVHYSGSLKDLLHAASYLKYVNSQAEAYQMLRDFGGSESLRAALALILFESGYKVQRRLYPLLQAELYTK